MPEDEDFSSFDTIYNDWERRYEHFEIPKSPLSSPSLTFSEYTGGAKLSRKERRHPSAQQEENHYQREGNYEQPHYYDLEYNPDGTVNTFATQANLHARTANSKRRASILVIIDGTLDKIKYSLASPDYKNDNKRKFKYSNGSKVNADVKIQFDGEKFIYRV